MADLQNDTNITAKVIEAVQLRTPNASNVRILSVQRKFLDGTLYTVAFDLTEDQDDGSTRISPYSNRVYVSKKNIEVYGHDEFLLQIVGARHSRSFYDFFANGDVISGVIALLVTVFIVPAYALSYLYGSEIVVPDWVTSGWLLILGFYFGKAAGRTDA